MPETSNDDSKRSGATPDSTAPREYEINGETKRFPIFGESARFEGKMGRAPRSYIPWWLAEIAYEEYARRYGRDQSMKRIAERGGFGRGELLTLLRGDEFKAR